MERDKRIYELEENIKRLNKAMDDYWNSKRSEAKIKAICEAQQESEGLIYPPNQEKP